MISLTFLVVLIVFLLLLWLFWSVIAWPPPIPKWIPVTILVIVFCVFLLAQVGISLFSK